MVIQKSADGAIIFENPILFKNKVFDIEAWEGYPVDCKNVFVKTIQDYGGKVRYFTHKEKFVIDKVNSIDDVIKLIRLSPKELDQISYDSTE